VRLAIIPDVEPDLMIYARGTLVPPRGGGGLDGEPSLRRQFLFMRGEE
jgi:hypothetical protein